MLTLPKNLVGQLARPKDMNFLCMLKINAREYFFYLSYIWSLDCWLAADENKLSFGEESVTLVAEKNWRQKVSISRSSNPSSLVFEGNFMKVPASKTSRLDYSFLKTGNIWRKVMEHIMFLWMHNPMKSNRVPQHDKPNQKLVQLTNTIRYGGSTAT